MRIKQTVRIIAILCIIHPTFLCCQTTELTQFVDGNQEKIKLDVSNIGSTGFLPCISKKREPERNRNQSHRVGFEDILYSPSFSDNDSIAIAKTDSSVTSKKISIKLFISLAREFNFSVQNYSYSRYFNISPASGYYFGTSFFVKRLFTAKIGLGLSFFRTTGITDSFGTLGSYSMFNESKHCAISFPFELIRFLGEKSDKYFGIGYQHFRAIPYDSWTYSTYGQQQSFIHDRSSIRNILEDLVGYGYSNSNLCLIGGFLIIGSQRYKLFFEVKGGVPMYRFSSQMGKPFLSLQINGFLI